MTITELIEELRNNMKKVVKNELIDEFLEDLDKFREEGYIPLVFEPLNKLIRKWEAKKDE